jgi:hypothetical protein
MPYDRAMRLEYLEDPDSQRPPVLLAYGNDPAEAVVLRRTVEQLAAGNNREVRVDQLPGFQGVDGCSLVASVGSADSGVEPVEGSDRAFLCALSAAGWERVSGLLEPFGNDIKPNRFQYLSEEGPIEWIISGHRGW